MTRFIVAAFLTILIVLPSSPSTAEARSNYDEMAVRNQFWQIMEKVDSEGATKSNINALGKFVKEYRTSSVTEEAYMALGELYIEINEFSKASSMYSKILEYFPRSRFKAEALFGLGHAQYRSGHMKAAVHNLRAVLSIVNTPMALKIQANKLLKAIEGIEANIEETRTDITIAAALPFGGSYARYAEDALKGILLASDIFSKETPSIKTEIRVVEIDPDAKSYANELNPLYKDHRVVSIVGPLMSKSSLKVASAAQKRKIPTLVLSQKEGVPETGHYIFRNSLTARMQARTLVQYATETLGLKKFAVLYPKNRYGEELAKYFKEAIEAKSIEVEEAREALATEYDDYGTDDELSDEERIEAEEKARAEKIELVGEVFYMDGQKDFGAELKELFKLKVEEKMVGRRLIREYTQEADIEALFIPDYYDAVAQIAPSLAYYNLQDMFLMGSNGWNSPKLLKLTKKHVEGAIFVDGFFKGSQTPAANEFIEKFRAAYGYTPGIVEAQAFDATRIILKAVERAGSGERKYVRQAIEDTFDFEGATGVISFDEHGEAKKDVTLLTVSKGKIKELFMDEKISVKSRITPDDEPQ